MNKHYKFDYKNLSYIRELLKKQSTKKYYLLAYFIGL